MSSSSKSAQKSTNTTQDLTVVGAEGSVTTGAHSMTTAAMAEDNSIAIGSADVVYVSQFSEQAFNQNIGFLNNALDMQEDVHETNTDFLTGIANSTMDLVKDTLQSGGALIAGLAADTTDFARSVVQDNADFLGAATSQILNADKSEGERIASQSMIIMAGVAVAAFFLMSNRRLA